MRVLNERRRKNLAIPILMLATFFNPLGFDILFKMTLDWTKDYWLTTGIFYLVSASLFGVYFWLLDKKPIIYFISIFKSRLFNNKKSK
jgi:hypothetical protein